jgi:hypothetical protein
MATKNSNGKGRTRNYATVVYPESAPENWQSVLADQCIAAFISPLHDKDLNESISDGSKKAHYHVMIMFDGVKTIEQAAAVFSLISGVGCEKVNSARGYARYLCHMDNPDKHQYALEDVRSLGGADYTSTIGLPTDKYKAISEMIDHVKSNDIVSYSILLEYAQMERYDWFRVLCDNGTVVVKEYLKSRDWTSRMNK